MPLTGSGWVAERGPIGTVWFDPEPGELVLQDGTRLGMAPGVDASLVTTFGVSAGAPSVTTGSGVFFGTGPVTLGLVDGIVTAMGRSAARNVTSGVVAAFGFQAALNATTQNICAFGNYAANIATGTNLTCIGAAAGSALTSGNNVTILGPVAGTAGMADTLILATGTTERIRYDTTNGYQFPSMAPVVSASTASTHKIPIRIGGTTYNLLATTV